MDHSPCKIDSIAVMASIHLFFIIIQCKFFFFTRGFVSYTPTSFVTRTQQPRPFAPFCRDDNDRWLLRTTMNGKKKKDAVNGEEEYEYEYEYEEVEEEYEGEELDEDEEYEYEYYYEEVEDEDYEEEEEEEEEKVVGAFDDEEEEDMPEWRKEQKELLTFIDGLAQAKAELDALDPDTVVANLDEEDKREFEEDELEAFVDEQVKPFLIDVGKITPKEMEKAISDFEKEPPMNETETFPPNDSWLMQHAGVTQEDLAKLSLELKTLQQNKENLKQAGGIRNIDMIDDDYVLSTLPEEIQKEILNLDSYVDTSEEDAYVDVPEKLREQRRRLIYDLGFNMTNVFLASFKVNRDAPVILEHWMYELRNWTRYDYVRDNGFNFTWDDVENANVTELEEYWHGAGMDSIPTPSRLENPNVVEWDENPLNFEEERMLAMEQWYDDVYADEDDIHLDDEDYMPHDNPAAPHYGETSEEDANDVDPVLKDVQDFEEKYGHMTEEWRSRYMRRQEFAVDHSSEEDEFRGHLVIACSPSDDDLDLAETLTLRMSEEFGPKVFVETRVIGHAKPEDHLYEIWLESWDIELLHSKRRAVFQRDWEGPRDMDEEYIDELVKKVEFLISDEKRYSYYVM